MKLLVTGGAGFVGGVCAKLLVDSGHDVVVVDDLSTGNVDALPSGVEFIEGDFADVAEYWLPRLGCDAVLHFAAKSLIGESVAAPDQYWHGNTVKSLRLLDAMRAAGTSRMVFSSTAATYGEPESLPITENAPTRPTNPYGASKLAIDLAISSYAVAFGLAATSFRYFNVAGAYGSLGERRIDETHLIPLALQVAAGRRAEITIFGTDWPTSDGTAVRDYIHVRDLAEAHILALDSEWTGSHRIFNLGTGTGFSVREVLSCCERVSGRLIRSRDVGRRPGDPAVLVASSKRAGTDLGWSPRRSTLEEIVGDAWMFIKSLA